MHVIHEKFLSRESFPVLNHLFPEEVYDERMLSLFLISSSELFSSFLVSVESERGIKKSKGCESVF